MAGTSSALNSERSRVAICWKIGAADQCQRFDLRFIRGTTRFHLHGDDIAVQRFSEPTGQFIQQHLFGVRSMQRIEP